MTLTHFLSKHAVIWPSIRPSAEAVRGRRTLNHPTVCTVGAVAPSDGFLRLNESVSQVC
jgi:hypothetical protein